MYLRLCWFQSLRWSITYKPWLSPLRFLAYSKRPCSALISGLRGTAGFRNSSYNCRLTAQSLCMNIYIYNNNILYTHFYWWGEMSTRIIQFSTALSVESCHVDSKARPEAAIDIAIDFQHNNTFYVLVACLWKYKAAYTSLQFITRSTLTISITIYCIPITSHHLSSSIPSHMTSLSQFELCRSTAFQGQKTSHMRPFCPVHSQQFYWVKRWTASLQKNSEPRNQRVKRCKTMYGTMRQNMT